MDNLQILCKICNLEKGTDKINFRNHQTLLKEPRPFKLFEGGPNETMANSIERIINFMYRASAVCDIKLNERRNGKNYHSWLITLHEGNPVEWIEQHKAALLEYVHSQHGWEHVQNIEFRQA